MKNRKLPTKVISFFLSLILMLSFNFVACEKNTEFSKVTTLHGSIEEKTIQTKESLTTEVPPEEEMIYDFDSYDSLYDAVVCPNKTPKGQLMNQESIAYGQKYSLMLQAFSTNTIELMIPEYNNKPAQLRQDDRLPIISFFTKELFNLPWIWYDCTIDNNSYYVKITYPTVLNLPVPDNAQTYLEVISALYPNSPMPNNYENFEAYSNIYEKELTIAGKKITALISELTGSDMIYVQLYMNDALIVLRGNKTVFTDKFFDLFNLVPFKQSETGMSIPDSLSVDDNIKQQMIKIDPGIDLSDAQIVRVYNTSIHFAFEKAQSIEDALSSGEVLSTYYVAILDNRVIMTAKEWQSDLVLVPNINISSDMISALRGDALKTLTDTDIKLNGVYLLWGEPSMSGSAICFLTDRGEYVWYTNFDYKNKNYLFPISDFCAYQRTIVEKRAEFAEYDGVINLSAVSDISQYEIRSQEMSKSTDKTNDDENTANKTAPKTVIVLGCVGIVILSLTIIVLFRRRRSS